MLTFISDINFLLLSSFQLFLNKTSSYNMQRALILWGESSPPFFSSRNRSFAARCTLAWRRIPHRHEVLTLKGHAVPEAALVSQSALPRVEKGWTRSWQQVCPRYTSRVPPSLSSSKNVAAMIWSPLPLTVLWPEIVTCSQSIYKGGWEKCGSTWTIWSATNCLYHWSGIT